MAVKIRNRFTGEVIHTHQDANLQGANLQGAYLQGAYLQGANLYGANLYGANLQGADLRGADLRGANLYGANLQGAYLQGADLRGADLRGAYLQGANLYGANLYGAVGSELALSRTVIVPEGSIVGWKKLRGGVIAKIRIPEAARRSNAAGRKCRAEFAEVLELSEGSVGRSQHDQSFVYKAGETVRCNEWCEDRWQECAGGIHFYLTCEEAEAH